MQRLIDANALIEKAYWHGEHPTVDRLFAEGVDAVDVSDIEEAPTIEAEPVRHGRWIEPQRLYYGAKQYECSLCYSDIFWKKHSITDKYPHCPNCGCLMDGGNDE